ncbi:stalk domain-containing protein [Paenibacillus chungangensis]|uniref:Stalk domain-containing protein n=1 Tax=Paenibacillus chungangensis TaxID=696535 RepID=A0ABW3HLW6_9BACL
MKTYFKKKWLVSGFVAVLLLSAAGHAWGSGTLREIKANLNSGLNIMLYGERFVAIDPETETELLPITYKGRTYLPLRSVAEATGLEVTWDGRTQTIYLGDAEEEVESADERIVQMSTEYARPKDKYRLASATPHLLNRGPDKEFKYGFSNDRDYQSNLQVYVTNDYEFHTLKATIWVDDLQNDAGIYSSPNPRIKLFNERNEVIYDMPEVKHKNYYEIEVDISDVEEVRILVDGVYSVIGDPVLVK